MEISRVNPETISNSRAAAPAMVSATRCAGTGGHMIEINAKRATAILHVGDDRSRRGKENLGSKQTNPGSDALSRRARVGWSACAAWSRDTVLRKSFMSMLATRRLVKVLLVGAAVAWPASWIGALEGTDTVAAARLPVPTFEVPQAAVHAGLEAGGSAARGSDGRASAIETLRRAADRGETLALWRIGNAYATGEGVPRDDLKAFDYFSRIVASYDEDSPSRRDRAIVASAFVALGTYASGGIESAGVRPDPAFALQMFRTAATSFGDANAQFCLARMYLDGVGIGKDSQQAARWLRLAADKGHPQAQARLGQLLFSGQESIKPHRAQGLMWLTLAREAALDAKKDQWIIDLYEKAMASADDEDRQVALAYLEDHLKRRN
jgi:TPR repeat protein